jgi:hypothetical protein
VSDINWGTVSAITMVVAALGSIGMVVLRAQLSHYFVTRSEFGEIETRLSAAERRVGEMPGHDDLRSILDRLAQGAGRFDTLAARMDGIKNAVDRTEVQVNMLFRAQLEREEHP